MTAGEKKMKIEKKGEEKEGKRGKEKGEMKERKRGRMMIFKHTFVIIVVYCILS